MHKKTTLALIIVLLFCLTGCGGKSFSLEGKWKSVGDYGFGQAQPGAIVQFNGERCNLFSPSDTYAFYEKDGEYILDATSLLAQTVTFKVEIIDNDTIHLNYGDTVTELERVD